MTDHESGDWGEMTYGIRWNGSWGSIGYSLAYLKTFNPSPIVSPHTLQLMRILTRQEQHLVTLLLTSGGGDWGLPMHMVGMSQMMGIAVQ